MTAPSQKQTCRFDIKDGLLTFAAISSDGSFAKRKGLFICAIGGSCRYLQHRQLAQLEMNQGGFMLLCD